MTFRLKILGSNAAAPAHNRNQTSQLLQINNQFFLIDCGEGTQILLKKYKIKFSKIDHILISHLHGDHYYGLIGLLSTMHLYGRSDDLNVYGPPGLKEIIALQLKYSDTSLNFNINFNEWAPGSKAMIYENDQMVLSTFPMDHRIDCSGFIFKEKLLNRKIKKETLPDGILPSQIALLKNGENVKSVDGDVLYNNSDYTLAPRKSLSYAYCSDTKYLESTIEIIRDVNVLYHEATFMEDMADRAELTYHSTAKQAATIAKQAEVGKLILGHFSTRYKHLEPILEEARSIFKESYLGIEGEDFILME